MAEPTTFYNTPTLRLAHSNIYWPGASSRKGKLVDQETRRNIGNYVIDSEPYHSALPDNDRVAVTKITAMTQPFTAPELPEAMSMLSNTESSVPSIITTL